MFTTVEQVVQNARATNGGIYVIENGGVHFDSGLRRPYLAEDGRVYVDVTTGYKPRKDANGNTVLNKASGEAEYDRIIEPQLVTERAAAGLPVLQVDNATVLTKDAWIRLDSVVRTASRKRLRAWADLRARNTVGGFDGMATPIMEYEVMTDTGQAVADMDGLSEGRNFQPLVGLQGLPLPITHCDFHMSERFLAASRASGRPQDLARAEMAGRRVGELIEQTLIGIIAGVEWSDSTAYIGTSKVYGYTTHPDRITKTDLVASATILAAIATTGGGTFVGEVLEMIEAAYAENFYGPFILYTSPAYDALLDNDLKANSEQTIRQRVRAIEQIEDVKRLDYLTGDVLLLVQMTSDVVEAINGQEIETVQWDTKGGMQKNFKVMAIQVPRIRSIYLNQTTSMTTGIVHATTS